MIQINAQGQIVKVESNPVTREQIVKKLGELKLQAQPILDEIANVEKDLSDYDALASTSTPPQAPTEVV